MNDQCSFNNVDSILFQLALQSRELSKKKTEILQQIKGLRVNIAERRSFIETINRNITKHEEDIRVKQSTLMHNKENAKSMKASNSLLRQYEQTLKDELESRKASYSHDMKAYEEKIASYRKVFQKHKEHYCRNPLAQKLLKLQAEKEEIESHIKACDDEITMKQEELAHLTGLAVNSSFTEEPPDSVSEQEAVKETEKQTDPHTAEDSVSSINISSLDLNQIKILQDGHKTSVDKNAERLYEENNVQDTTASIIFPQEASDGLWSCQQLNEQTWEDGVHNKELDPETGTEEQVLDEVEAVEQEKMDESVAVQKMDESSAVQEKMDESLAVEEEQAPSNEDEALTAFLQSPFLEMNPQTTPTKVKAVPSTPTFTFSFSPGSSPRGGSSDTKSPAFPFSLSTDPGTSSFTGFGFDVGSSKDEDSPFAFPGSFFNKKKTTDAETSRCPEFLFDQQAHSEDFKFAFTSKSPQATSKDNTREEFPFSFNF